MLLKKYDAKSLFKNFSLFLDLKYASMNRPLIDKRISRFIASGLLNFSIWKEDVF